MPTIASGRSAATDVVTTMRPPLFPFFFMLTPVEGGYRLTGRWDFCSGIPHSTHLVCGAQLPATGGPPEMFCVAVPREKLRILDDWGGDQTLGMRPGTQPKQENGQ